MHKLMITLSCLLSFSSLSIAESKVILGSRVFSLVEKDKPNCGKESGGPEYAAALFLMNTAQGLAERLGGPQQGLEALFKFIRNYPSRFSHTACAALRDECESRCLKLSIAQADVCKIDCNQYESWNR